MNDTAPRTPDIGAVSSVEDVPLDGVAAAYHLRGLDRWSDDRLVAAVAQVIAVPRKDAANSFVLHAPLELLARRRLLQLMDPSARYLARLHILSIAAEYQAAGPGLDTEDPHRAETESRAPGSEGLEGPEARTDRLVAELLRAVAAGDLDEVDRVGRQIELDALVAHVDPRRFVELLAPAILASTAAAAHAPIFLRFLGNAGRDARAMVPMIRPLARELARHPSWRIDWMDHAAPAARPGERSTDDLHRTLAEAPRLGIPGSSFIHPVMSQVDTADLAGALLPGVTGHRTPESARTVLRVAAQSMLGDDSAHGPYGWSHCLTLPQAALAVDASSTGLAVAATHVLGFRSALGATDLGPLDLSAYEQLTAGDRAARISALATASGSRHDAHIAKYGLATIDAAVADPAAADLFLSAGERLLAIWDELGGHEKDHLDR